MCGKIMSCCNSPLYPTFDEVCTTPSAILLGFPGFFLQYHDRAFSSGQQSNIGVATVSGYGRCSVRGMS